MLMTAGMDAPSESGAVLRSATKGSSQRNGGCTYKHRGSDGPTGAGTKVNGIQKLKIRRGDRMGVPLSEGKGGLIEDIMMRDNDLVGSKVKTAVTLAMSRVSQKDTQS